MIKGNIVTFKNDDGKYIDKAINTDEDIVMIRDRIVIVENKESGHINIAIPTEIAKVGLIEGTKDARRKEELAEKFWEPLLEWGKKHNYI